MKPDAILCADHALGRTQSTYSGTDINGQSKPAPARRSVAVCVELW
jgi:hypothetical protein